ncbi:dihydrofolate reductase [Mycoplasma phocoenae]|uniref:dihydrofolate reductase n=1 Tax=Mycoplasma phocoenae TaxID=754517 RepID=A0A858U659_9MOLU|nr:dihydrofolate reductase [Mycoplasma phocoenae]QJG66745.1 dihydrofolate reductase [Mycoplasma phocoenae]
MIKLIVAMDEHNLIGKGDKMPWHIKEEFIHFKNTTLTHALLFGRRTFLGLPGKLLNRKSIVLSPDDIETADLTIHNDSELTELFKKYKDSKEVLFIAGGKSIYESFYQYADELIVSRIKGKFEGDVYLNLDLSSFDKEKVIEHEKFNVEYWQKKKQV